MIEDLHWAEAPLLELVEAIVGRSDGPLLLVATARPELAEARPGWGYRPGMSQVVLQPLNDGHTDELVDRLLPARDEALRRRVARKAEGNPFFAEELARHLEAGGERREIPNTVRALLAARIDALPADERRVLRHAAVVGRTFWATALEPFAAAEALRGLEARGFVVPRPASALPGHTEFAFVHGLTREVAYHSIPRADRCHTHAAVARWIESRVGDRREEFVELLAYHYEAAARPADAALAWPEGGEEVRAAAVRALVEAGDAARRRMAVEQAVRFADRALALAVDAERVAALELKGRSFHAAIRGDEALAAYVEAIAIADRAAASRLRGLAILLCTRYAGSFSKPGWTETAIALVDEGLAADGDEPASFATGALRLGRYWGMRRWRAEGFTRDYSMEDAKRDAVRAVEIAEEIRSSLLLAVALEGLTWLSFDEGHRHAAELGRRHLHAASVLADPVEAHESLTVAVMCFARAGDFARARATADQATEQAARLSPHRRLHAATAQALACVPSGALDELRAVTADVPELIGDGACSTAVVGLAGRVLALHEARDPAAAEAIALLERIAPPARPLGGWGHTVLEMVRPAIGLEAARERLDALEPAHDVAALRAAIPVRALSGDTGRLRALLDEARAREEPDLAAFADWGEAALTGDHRPRPARGRRRSTRAASTTQPRACWPISAWALSQAASSSPSSSRGSRSSSARRIAPSSGPRSASGEASRRGGILTIASSRRRSGASRTSPARATPPPMITTSGLTIWAAVTIPWPAQRSARSTISSASSSPAPAAVKTASGASPEISRTSCAMPRAPCSTSKAPRNASSPAAPAWPRMSLPPTMIPAPIRSPASTQTASSMPRAAPRQCSAITARLQSFSTTIGRERMRASAPARSKPSGKTLLNSTRPRRRVHRAGAADARREQRRRARSQRP